MKTTNTTKTASIIILDETHVQVTKAFAKNARIFGTAEYKTWRAVLKDLPGAEMVTKTIKIDFENNTLTMNYTFAAAAGIYGTPENKLLMKIQKDLHNNVSSFSETNDQAAFGA